MSRARWSQSKVALRGRRELRVTRHGVLVESVGLLPEQQVGVFLVPGLPGRSVQDQSLLLHRVVQVLVDRQTDPLRIGAFAAGFLVEEGIVAPDRQLPVAVERKHVVGDLVLGGRILDFGV